MAISHVKNLTEADGSDATLCRPSDWNSIHNMTYNLAGNTANTNQVTGTDIILYGGNNITLSGTSNSVQIYDAPAMNQMVNCQFVTVGATAQQNTRVTICPITVPYPLVVSQIQVGVSLSCASAANTSTAPIGYSQSIVLYTLNASTLSYLTSFNNATSSFWRSSSTSVIAGARHIDATGAAITLNPGIYWAALHISTNNPTGAANSTALGMSLFVANAVSQATAQMQFDHFTAGASATSRNISYMGIYGTSATLSSIAIADAAFTQTGASMNAAFPVMRLGNTTVF